MKKGFEKLEQDYSDSNHDIGQFLKSLQAMAYAMKKENGVDADWIYKAALHHLKAKTATYVEDRRIGLMAALLVGHGASFNQVMLSFCEWFGISETKVKNAYYAVCKEYDLPRNAENMDNKKFMKVAEVLPYRVFMQIEKPFPNRYPKARHAFLSAYNHAEWAYIRHFCARFGHDLGENPLLLEKMEK